MEEYCILKHLWDSSTLFWCDYYDGAIRQFVVSHFAVASFPLRQRRASLTYTEYSFQEVQHLSALQTGLRIMPSLLVGVLLNFTTGLFVDRVPVIWIVTVSSVLCSVAPLLMAVISPTAPYWTNAFFAQLLAPVSTDVLFTIGLIIISDNFPDTTQALAGAVFNTANQFGQALSLAVMQIVSTLVTKDSNNKNETLAYMEGLRASFWTMFAFMMTCVLWGFIGLRKTGHIGLKRD